MTNNGLVHYSNQQLKIIEEFAFNLIAPIEIAQFLEVETDLFLNGLKNEKSDVYKSFYRGLYRTELAVKKSSLLPVDVETEEFRLKQLKDFKSKIIIQLHG